MNATESKDTVFVSGASSGIGMAVARRFARDGARLVLSARREERLRALAAELGGEVHVLPLDVRSREGVQAAVASLPEAFADVSVLVNNAGLAAGLGPAQEADLDDWDRMVDTNVRGLMYLTRALLPGMVRRQRGHVVNVGSVAGSYPYPGGNVYGGTKAFVAQLSLNLRADLLGTGVRVTSIEPGMVETEFSLVRFAGDEDRAKKVYEGVHVLSPDDVAEAIHWCTRQPAHVNVNRIEMMPVMQAFSPFAVKRGGLGDPVSRAPRSPIALSTSCYTRVAHARTRRAPKENGMSETAKLSYGEQTLEMKVIEGTEQERGVDIGSLRAKTGLITLDPGFMNTGSCQSAVTFIDGDKGILRYRGYSIEELAEKSSFLEVSYLLLEGALPTKDQLETFTRRVQQHTMLHEDVKRFYSGFPKNAHPMAVCAAVCGAMSTFYQDSLDIQDAAQVDISTIRLLAKFPTMAACSYKHSIGQPFLYPVNRLDYTTNFLHMMFATPCEEYLVNPVIAKALDLLLVLHADHEQNCWTRPVRLVGSSQANLFASISAGVNALWGPLHGGANQAVIEMLNAVEQEGISGKAFLERAKDKNDTTRLMGFGHRVYKNFDPRARIIKKACADVLGQLKTGSKLLEIAVELEEMALKDEYFITRKLYPNVDFYSGIIYQAIGIPVNMFTVLFAMGRLPGWIAHWKEMHKDPATKIGRPRQIYTGPTHRGYVPIDQRLGAARPLRLGTDTSSGRSPRGSA